jgi:hypothetical protein
VIAAGLRQVAATGDAESRGQRLQQDRHHVRHEDHAEQRVTVAGAAGEVGRPVAGIHVADGDEVARPGKGEELSPEPGIGGNGNGAVYLAQAQFAARQPPAVRSQLLNLHFDYSKFTSPLIKKSIYN